MIWSEVNFGKYRGKGKTLPQILFSDPDWFFWAIDDNVFQNKGSLYSEAKDLDYKARNIKIPDNEHGILVVEYVIHRPSEKFSHFEVVPANQPIHSGSSPTHRKTVIDMSFPRQLKGYDKLGCKKFLSFLKVYVFGNMPVTFTKKKCEDFFNNPDNFS